MLTKSDIKIIQSLLEEQEEKVKVLLEEQESRFKNDVLTFKDEILTEVVKLREDMTITKGYGDRLEDHEERITRLEPTPKTS